MPVMDGMEALDHHTSHPGYQEDFMSWAADAYLMKSTDLKEFKEKIRELL